MPSSSSAIVPACPSRLPVCSTRAHARSFRRSASRGMATAAPPPQCMCCWATQGKPIRYTMPRQRLTTMRQACCCVLLMSGFAWLQVRVRNASQGLHPLAAGMPGPASNACKVKSTAASAQCSNTQPQTLQEMLAAILGKMRKAPRQAGEQLVLRAGGRNPAWVHACVCQPHAHGPGGASCSSTT